MPVIATPEYSMEAFDWDWASFHENILLPNRMHIQLVMQLSDTIKDRVVYSIHFLLNDWNGNDDECWLLQATTRPNTRVLGRVVACSDQQKYDFSKVQFSPAGILPTPAHRSS